MRMLENSVQALLLTAVSLLATLSLLSVCFMCVQANRNS